MPETCRVLWQNKFWIFDVSSWLFYMKRVTMHGHLNIKLSSYSYIRAAPWRPMEPLQTYTLDRQKSHLRSKTVKANVFLSFNGITKECRRRWVKAMRIAYLGNSWRLWGVSRSGCFNYDVPPAYEVGRRSKHPLTNIYVKKKAKPVFVCLYLLLPIFTYFLHGAESFLRS